MAENTLSVAHLAKKPQIVCKFSIAFIIYCRRRIPSGRDCRSRVRSCMDRDKTITTSPLRF